MGSAPPTISPIPHPPASRKALAAVIAAKPLAIAKALNRMGVKHWLAVGVNVCDHRIIRSANRG